MFGSKKTATALALVKPVTLTQPLTPATAEAKPPLAKAETKPEIQTQPAAPAQAETKSTTTEVLASENKTENTSPAPVAVPAPVAPPAANLNPPRENLASNPAEQVPASPNAEIENNLPPAPTYIKADLVQPSTWADRFIGWENYINYGVLLLMLTALLINIFVKIRIQHKPVILQTLILIVFIVSLIYVHFHILENFSHIIAII